MAIGVHVKLPCLATSTTSRFELEPCTGGLALGRSPVCFVRVATVLGVLGIDGSFDGRRSNVDPQVKWTLCNDALPTNPAAVESGALTAAPRPRP